MTSKKIVFFEIKFHHIYTTFLKYIRKCILAFSASLLKVHGEVLNAVLDLFDFHFVKSIFGNDQQKIFHSYVKSKPIFKIHLFFLSKLAEQAEIHLFYDSGLY